jgi:hypothetical protein
MSINKEQNSLNTLAYFIVNFHLHVSAGNPAIFRVTFVLHEYSVIKSLKLLHSIEIRVIVA